MTCEDYILALRHQLRDKKPHGLYEKLALYRILKSYQFNV
jgi:hypothetical protein